MRAASSCSRSRPGRSAACARGPCGLRGTGAGTIAVRGTGARTVPAPVPRTASRSSPSATPAGNKSGRKVFCVKFQKELPGLDDQPWPGELGQRIFENVSVDAWKLWEERMKMILNEYRLMPWQKEAQELVAKHMEDFF